MVEDNTSNDKDDNAKVVSIALSSASTRSNDTYSSTRSEIDNSKLNNNNSNHSTNTTNNNNNNKINTKSNKKKDKANEIRSIKNFKQEKSTYTTSLKSNDDDDVDDNKVVAIPSHLSSHFELTESIEDGIGHNGIVSGPNKGTAGTGSTSAVSSRIRFLTRKRRRRKLTTAEREELQLLRNTHIPHLLLQSYHLPGFTYWEDLTQFLSNNHPVFGLCCRHEFHPIKFKTRAMSLLGSMLFGLSVTNAIYIAFALNSQYQYDKLYFSFETGYTTGSSYLDNSITGIQVTNGNVALWTVGAALHALYDTAMWEIASCRICMGPGSSRTRIVQLQKKGLKFIVLFVILAIVSAAGTIFIREMIDNGDITTAAYNNTDTTTIINVNDMDNKGLEWDLTFLVSYCVELGLNYFFYYPLFALVFFTGVLGCGHTQAFGGRPYEMKIEQEDNEWYHEQIMMYGNGTMTTVTPTTAVTTTGSGTGAGTGAGTGTGTGTASVGIGLNNNSHHNNNSNDGERSFLSVGSGSIASAHSSSLIANIPFSRYQFRTRTASKAVGLSSSSQHRTISKSNSNGDISNSINTNNNNNNNNNNKKKPDELQDDLRTKLARQLSGDGLAGMSTTGSNHRGGSRGLFARSSSSGSFDTDNNNDNNNNTIPTRRFNRKGQSKSNLLLNKSGHNKKSNTRTGSNNSIDCNTSDDEFDVVQVSTKTNDKENGIKNNNNNTSINKNSSGMSVLEETENEASSPNFALNESLQSFCDDDEVDNSYDGDDTDNPNFHSGNVQYENAITTTTSTSSNNTISNSESMMHKIGIEIDSITTTTTTSNIGVEAKEDIDTKGVIDANEAVNTHEGVGANVTVVAKGTLS